MPVFNHDSTSVSPSELCLLPPTVPGFSLALREWGELSVTLFSPITFRSDAWEKLVLEAETKSLVRGLVECNEGVRRARKKNEKMVRRDREREEDGSDGNASDDGTEDAEESVVSDIIEGKGGGLVRTFSLFHLLCSLPPIVVLIDVLTIHFPQVIALHGLPGVGKTLTAEAVAESLQVPLYTVGAGSLGASSLHHPILFLLASLPPPS
jgi:hypothetical protein